MRRTRRMMDFGTVQPRRIPTHHPNRQRAQRGDDPSQNTVAEPSHPGVVAARHRDPLPSHQCLPQQQQRRKIALRLDSRPSDSRPSRRSRDSRRSEARDAILSITSCATLRSTPRTNLEQPPVTTQAGQTEAGALGFHHAYGIPPFRDSRLRDCAKY